jgi:hypothetical protein
MAYEAMFATNPNLAPSSPVLRSGSNASTFQAGQAWEIIFNQPLVSCDRPSHHCDLGHQHLDALVILWASDKPKKKDDLVGYMPCITSVVKNACVVKNECLALLLWSGVSCERMIIHCFHLPRLLSVYIFLAVKSSRMMLGVRFTNHFSNVHTCAEPEYACDVGIPFLHCLCCQERLAITSAVRSCIACVVKKVFHWGCQHNWTIVFLGLPSRSLSVPLYDVWCDFHKPFRQRAYVCTTKSLHILLLILTTHELLIVP